MWLCKFLTCSKSNQVTKEIQPLAEALADGQVVALGPIFLAYLYRCLCDITRDPEFGFTESFKAWWGKMSATWFSQPSEIHMERIFWGCACSSTYYSFKQATKEASADSSHSQGEKRPLPSTQDVGEGQNSSGYDVEIPPADDIILARPRKIPRNPLPPSSSRIVEQPNPTHSAEFRTPILETEVGGQIATSKAEVEMEVIGANLSTNPDVIVAETQPVTQPSRSRGVDRGVINGPSHIPDHQTIPADQTANASGVPPVIPVTLSAEHASQIPQLPSDVSIPILTYQQPEVGEPIMPDLSSVRACTAGALVENGSEQPLSTDQDDLIQSLLDHALDDIFAYLDQWDASATTAEASTRHATSSTMAGVLPDPAAEALLRSYKDRDCISLADQDERDRVKAAIEALVNSGFFPDQTTIRTIMHLFGEVARLIPRHPSLREELRVGESLERQIASSSAIIRQKVELGRKKRHEVESIDEQMRQLQEKKAAILAEVSEDIRSYGPLEAQLRQDSVAVKSFEARKLPIISAGESACESFRTALRSLFPDV
ncbi:unnamed protein product [Prunus brigantina]